MTINDTLSVKGCWRMVNRAQADDPKEQLRRCRIADEWLKANKVIGNDDYNDLMMSLTYLMREAYKAGA